MALVEALAYVGVETWVVSPQMTGEGVETNVTTSRMSAAGVEFEDADEGSWILMV
jgi:hypothetical protein